MSLKVCGLTFLRDLLICVGMVTFLPAWRGSLRVERGEILMGYEMISLNS